MDRYLRIIITFVSVVYMTDITAQNAAGGSGIPSLPGTGVEMSYNKTQGNITDDFTARAAYKFCSGKNFSISANARYHYMNADFSDAGSDNEVESLHGLGMDGSHNVYQLGVNALYHTKLFGKPFMAVGMITSDFSNEGFERINFMGGGVFMLTMTRKTQFGLGAFLLLNTASRWPLFPMVVYHHDFNPSLSLNIYGRTFGLDYTLTKQDRVTAGFDIDSRTFYFRPDAEGLPETCRYTSTLFRPMLKYRRTLTKGLNACIEAGEEMKVSSRIYGRNGTKRYMDVKQPSKPFVQVSVEYIL